MRKIIWQDFETGGLDPAVHSPLSFAMLATDGDKIIGEWYTQIRQTPLIVDPGALTINKIDITKPGLDFPSFKKEYLARMNEWFFDGGRTRPSKDNMPYYGGHNTAFDRPYLHRILGSTFDLANYHRVDTMVLASSFRAMGLFGAENAKLETIAKALGCYPGEEMHNALVDIRTTFQVFLKFKKLIMHDGITTGLP